MPNFKITLMGYNEVTEVYNCGPTLIDVKVFLKLKIKKVFKLGHIIQLGDLKIGNISHWLILYNESKKILEIRPFIMYSGDPQINLNLFHSAYNPMPTPEEVKMFEMFGGGVI